MHMQTLSNSRLYDAHWKYNVISGMGASNVG